MIDEYDTIKTKIDLTNEIKVGTIGVGLSVYDKVNYLLVEFLDKNHQTIENGMTTVNLKDVELVYKFV